MGDTRKQKSWLTDEVKKAEYMRKLVNLICDKFEPVYFSLALAIFTAELVLQKLVHFTLYSLINGLEKPFQYAIC